MENKARVIGTQELRRSNASGAMQDKRTRRQRDRAAKRRSAIRDQEA